MTTSCDLQFAFAHVPKHLAQLLQVMALALSFITTLKNPGCIRATLDGLILPPMPGCCQTIGHLLQSPFTYILPANSLDNSF
jgi:hypothetical protein